ncbi:hypothetical protein CHARACLAT_018116 [Characodon lateralis]|uniref:Uncharacterized protein n=1 Tax=Characodon lateralis TaxID=208331 RepID=A0ABU7DS41_9TELE|nr:hypothetical protein [Characodon lateralis]
MTGIYTHTQIKQVTAETGTEELCLHLITRSAGLALLSDILDSGREQNRKRGGEVGQREGGGLSLLLSKAEMVLSGPPASVDNKRGRWALLPLQQWHHLVEAPRSLGRGKPAAAPVVTLEEERRIPSRRCCGMLGSRVFFVFFLWEEAGGVGLLI